MKDSKNYSKGCKVYLCVSSAFPFLCVRGPRLVIIVLVSVLNIHIIQVFSFPSANFIKGHFLMIVLYLSGILLILSYPSY